MTFAEARTACETRWGTPTEEHDGNVPNTLPQARWGVGNHEVIPTEFPVALVLTLDMCGFPEEEWTLRGDPTENAPLTAISVALDDADTLLGSFTRDH